MMHSSILSRSRRAVAGSLVAVLPALLVAALVSGCSFSWGDGGLSDVLFGGKTTAELAPEAPDETKAAVGAEKASDDEVGSLTKVAIFPVAYIDATSSIPCDLCPSTLEMKPTRAMSARLATGFTYEAITRHPRFLFPSMNEVDKAIAAAPGHSYRQALAALGNAGRADLGVVSALLAMRPRIGPDNAPTTPAGVALYVSLVDARSGKVLWSDIFDEDESGRGWILGAYDTVMNDQPIRWSTADEHCEYAVDELIEDLVDEVE